MSVPSIQHTCRLFLVTSAIITLSACGGGSGDSPSSLVQNPLIIGGSPGGDASTMSDDQLRMIAADLAGSGLGENLDNLVNLSNDAQANVEPGSLGGDIVGDTETEALGDLQSSNTNFLNNSLGINDPGARTTRTGNSITIDPDDETLCGDDIPLASGVNDDALRCQQLASDLIVTVDAVTAESGIITYLFQSTPVLLIGYSPMGASYEIKLAGLQQVMRRAEELDGQTPDQSITMSGALRLSAMILNDEVGSEAGELSLNVTEAILIGSSTQEERISLQPSTVFALALDQQTGDVSTSVNWGALQLITSSSDSDGNVRTNAVNLGGLSAALTFNENQPTVQISNIGLGEVPLNITINSVESLSFSLANFGLSLNSDTGMIELNGPLSANLMVNNMAQLLEGALTDFTATASIAAPSGTSLIPQNNGSTLLSSGGPLTATLIGGDSQASGQSEVSINAGECFGEALDTQDSNLATSAIAVVPCN